MWMKLYIRILCGVGDLSELNPKKQNTKNKTASNSFESDAVN